MDKMNTQNTIAVDMISNNEIISRILNGEKDLYAMIVRKYNQRLYRVAMAIINDDAEVEDVMQVAYIKAYENIGKFEFKSNFSTWLTRILINESLLRLRKRKQAFKSIDLSMNKESYQSQTMDNQTPLSKVINTELKSVLEKSIQALPEKYRTVFVMREIENMNVAETKECLGITEVNVKVRLNRAKALLRDSLNVYLNKEELLHFHLSRCDKMVENVMKQIGSF